jgi:hypothetical protein
MCARAPVQVATLPGFGAPLSNTYSGYVAAGAGKHHHVSLGFARLRAMVENPRAFPFHAHARLCSQYVYMESLNNPATDDLVIWFNGGKWRAQWRGGDVPRACADRFFFSYSAQAPAARPWRAPSPSRACTTSRSSRRRRRWPLTRFLVRHSCGVRQRAAARQPRAASAHLPPAPRALPTPAQGRT